MNLTEAYGYCKNLNATLPLPLSLLEYEVFSNFSSPNKTWIGITDPLNSGKKENWRDVLNKQPVYVKLMVKNSYKACLYKFQLNILTIKSGIKQNQTGTVQQLISTKVASSIQTKLKVIKLYAFKRSLVSYSNNYFYSYSYNIVIYFESCESNVFTKPNCQQE